MISNHASFWFVAGAMTSLAACILSVPLYGRLRELRSRLPAGLIVIGTIVIAAGAAASLYALWGKPEAINLGSTAAVLASHAARPGAAASAGGMSQGAATRGGPTQVESVEQATVKLAERLNSKGGSSADWLLLAQSYEFMGRASDAAKAREHAGQQPAAAGAAPAATSAAPAAAGAASAAPTPAPVVSAAANQLLAQAEKYRIARNYPKAIDAYKRLVAMHAMSADAWANYADTSASANHGNLAGAPSEYLMQALRLDPDHPKALWLQASLLHEQHRYLEAQGVWQHLAGILPANSPDAKIIADNIAEAQKLTGNSPASTMAAAAPAAPASDAQAQISGEVDIDPKLKSKAASGLTLFVFAKAVDSPGPPLAVLRTSVAAWPMKFSLNDSQAMLPQRKLSDFQSVIVEARISNGGQPLAQRGDLQGTSGAVDPKSDKPVRVIIRDVIS